MIKQLGLSLVELMISITLGLVLMTGVVQMFLSSKVVFSNQQALSRVQETGRLAIDFIARDVRMAAYYGCLRINGQEGNKFTPPVLASIGGLHENFADGIMGFDSYENLPHGVAADLGAALTPTPKANILVVRAATQIGSIIDVPSTPNNVLARSNGVGLGADGCAGAFCPGIAAIASDCSKAKVFRVNNLAVAGTSMTINHTDVWAETFTTGQVMPLNTIVYFIATGPRGVSGLWQRTNNGTPLELLEGVENMRVTYATTNALGEVVGGYQEASKIAANDWVNVGSVRIELLVGSIEKNVLSEPQKYTFGIGPEIEATDRRLRQVFSTVVAIRSRMAVN